MPGKMTGMGKGRVKVTWGGRTVAKSTSPRKGRRQLNLLQGIKHSWSPTQRKVTRSMSHH